MSRTIVSVRRARRLDTEWWRAFGWALSLKFEPRDLWVGIYWDRPGFGRLDVYVCLLPVLPIHLSLWGLR